MFNYEFQEHTPPGKTLIVESTNGIDWSKPTVAFPEYSLPEIKNILPSF